MHNNADQETAYCNMTNHEFGFFKDPLFIIPGGAIAPIVTGWLSKIVKKDEQGIIVIKLSLPLSFLLSSSLLCLLSMSSSFLLLLSSTLP